MNPVHYEQIQTLRGMMLAEERRQIIIECLNESGTVKVVDLCQALDVSEMTIRRDLDILERSGLLRRVHGGAVSTRTRSYEPPFLLRSGRRSVQKAQIGSAAAALVREGDSLIIDVGTTTLEVARALKERRNLTILTPSLRVASLLADQPDNRLILTGGVVRLGEHSLVGHIVEAFFQEFNVDKLFLGIGGIDFETGLTEFNPEDAAVKRAMLASARECIVVADSSKFGEIAFANVASLAVVHRIVTDAGIAPAARSRLEKMNIDVIVAEAAEKDTG